MTLTRPRSELPTVAGHRILKALVTVGSAVIVTALAAGPATATSVEASPPGSMEILSNPERIQPHPTTPKVWDRDQWVDRDAYAFGDLKWEGPAIPLPADPVKANQVLIIGDSITQHSAELLKAQGEAAGINGRVDAVGSRYIYDGIQALNRGIAPGATDGIPKTVFIALGTNGKNVPAWTRETLVDNMMAALGPERNVIWINAYWSPKVCPTSHPEQFNSILREKARSTRNLHVLDWAAEVQKSIDRQESIVDSASGIYPTEQGYKLRTEWTIASINKVR